LKWENISYNKKLAKILKNKGQHVPFDFETDLEQKNLTQKSKFKMQTKRKKSNFCKAVLPVLTATQ